MSERTHWVWEYGARRQDGRVFTSPQPEYPWTTTTEARRHVDAFNDAARRLGLPETAQVIRRKRWVTVRVRTEGWEADQ